MWGTTTSRATGGTAGIRSSPLAEEYRETVRGLLEKQKALEGALPTAGAEGRRQLRYKLAMLREMVRDARAVLRRLDPPKPKPRAGGWARLDGLKGGALDYLAWQQVESFANNNDGEVGWMKAVVDDGTTVLTSRQRQVFLLHWKEGLARKEIAARLGRDVSTINRTLQRATDKVRRYADARTLAAGCVREDGSVDLQRLIRQAVVLSERQRQVLLLYLAGLPVWAIGKKLGIKGCTVTRTRQRGERNLRLLTQAMGKQPGGSLAWDATCQELARDYGISLGTVYRVLGGLQAGEGGMSLLQREIAKRRRAGQRAGGIAQELGLSVGSVYRYLRMGKEGEGQHADDY